MYRVDVLTRFKVTQVPLMYLFCVMHHNWPTRESDLMFITDTNTFFALNSSNAWSSRLFGDHILLSLSLTIPGYSRASSSTCIWKSKEERYSARKWSIDSISKLLCYIDRRKLRKFENTWKSNSVNCKHWKGFGKMLPTKKADWTFKLIDQKSSSHFSLKHWVIYFENDVSQIFGKIDS